MGHERTSRSGSFGRLLLGLTFLAAGVLFTAHNLEIVDVEPWLEWWPVLLVVVGLLQTVLTGGVISRFMGFGLALAGGMILSDPYVDWERYFDEQLDIAQLWPIPLIVLGFYLILAAMPRRGRRKAEEPTAPPDRDRYEPPPYPEAGMEVDMEAESRARKAAEKVGAAVGYAREFGSELRHTVRRDRERLKEHMEDRQEERSERRDDDKRRKRRDRVSAFVLMGGEEKVYSGQRFRGGSLTAILGGVDLDLRDAEMEDDEVVLDVTAICGGGTIKVPEHWEVDFGTFVVLGGMENKTRPGRTPEQERKRLILRGLVLMGGFEVKN